MGGFTVAGRLRLLVGLTIMGLLLVSLTALFQLKDSMLTDRQDKLKSQVETASNVLKHFHLLAQNGKMTDDEARQAARETLRQVRYSGNEYIFIYHTDGVTFMLPVKPEFEGQNKWDLTDKTGKFFLRELIQKAQNGGGFTEYLWDRTKGAAPEPKLTYTTLFEPWNLVVGTGVFIDDIEKAFWRSALMFAGISGALLLLISFVGWRIGRGVLKQLGGEPAEAAAIMQRVADGDLTAHLSDRPAGSLLHSLDTMVGALRTLVTDIRRDAETLVGNAAQIASASDHVASAAERQSDATAAMAAAIEELTVSSSHISDSARETSADSRQAVEFAGEGEYRVGQAREAIQRVSSTVAGVADSIRTLEERANQISSIANVIKDIAGQTNLLALNAAIEAARAGEQGRGFAVVADEVRKLAERTSLATTEIEQMLVAIQSDTSTAVAAMGAALPEVEQGVNLAAQASESLRAIEDGANRTLARVGEVADATHEQSAASTAIAQRVEEIANMVDETTATIRNTTTTAHQLENIANNLKALISRFSV